MFLTQYTFFSEWAALPLQRERPMPAFCHHLSTKWTIRHIGRLPYPSQPGWADKLLPDVRNWAFWRKADCRLFKGKSKTSHPVLTLGPGMDQNPTDILSSTDLTKPIKQLLFEPIQSCQSAFRTVFVTSLNPVATSLKSPDVSSSHRGQCSESLERSAQQHLETQTWDPLH